MSRKYDAVLSDAELRCKYWEAEAVKARAENERLRQALDDDPRRWSFATLRYVGQRILNRHYSADVFDGSSGDPGPAYIVALRDTLAALGDDG